jgi:hypothetical protein
MRFSGFVAAVAASLTLSATPIRAQTINPGDQVSGTVIVDGNNFMQAQHMSNLITSGDALTQRNFQMLMSSPGGSRGGMPSLPKMVDPKLLGQKTHDLDKFSPTTSTAPHDLAVKLSHGDLTKEAKIEAKLRQLREKFIADTKLEDKHYVSGSYLYLMLTSFAIAGSDSKRVIAEAKTEFKPMADALEEYVAAVQLANGHPATDAEKQRTFDIVAISTAALDEANDQADKGNDTTLKEKVKARAASQMKSLFGCSVDTMSLHDCVTQLGSGSAKFIIKRGDAFMQL